MASLPMMTTEVTHNMTKTTLTVAPMFHNGSGNASGQSVFQNPFNQPSVRVTFILLYSIVFAMCFLGNIVVLVVFAYSKRMRTRTNLFLANLAVADFCVGVFCVLPSLSIQLSPIWTLGRVMCKLYFFVNYLAYTASILLLVVIAVERYIAIMHPLRSRGYFTAPRLLVAQRAQRYLRPAHARAPSAPSCMSSASREELFSHKTTIMVVVWVVAAAYNVPILLMFDTMETPMGAFCYLTVSLMNLKAYYTAHFMLWYLLPLAVILVMYGRISCTLWASSATAVPVSRSDSRGSVSLTLALDTQIHHSHHHAHVPPTHHHHHQHHHNHHGVNSGRISMSYCDGAAENGFGSVVTMGALAGHEAGRHGESGNVESRRSDGRGFYGSKIRLMDGEEGGRGMVRNSSRGADLDRTAQRLLARSPTREAEGGNQIEMTAMNGCSDCFSCMQSRAAAGGGSTSYLYRLDSAHISPAAGKRHNKKHLNVDDYVYEMSDIHSSDDYDSFQSRGEGGGGRTGAGGTDVKNYANGYGGNAAPRRLRTHCRISSQRGLTSRRRVIRLLVAVVTIFAICVFPYHLKNLLHYWNVESPGGLFDYLTPISAVMMYLNCGLNPFIYWMFSDHFRRSLKETMCFWKRTQRNISRMMLSSPKQNKTLSIKPYDAM